MGGVTLRIQRHDPIQTIRKFSYSGDQQCGILVHCTHWDVAAILLEPLDTVFARTARVTFHKMMFLESYGDGFRVLGEDETFEKVVVDLDAADFNPHDTEGQPQSPDAAGDGDVDWDSGVVPRQVQPSGHMPPSNPELRNGEDAFELLGDLGAHLRDEMNGLLGEESDSASDASGDATQPAAAEPVERRDGATHDNEAASASTDRVEYTPANFLQHVWQCRESNAITDAMPEYEINQQFHVERENDDGSKTKVASIRVAGESFRIDCHVHNNAGVRCKLHLRFTNDVDFAVAQAVKFAIAGDAMEAAEHLELGKSLRTYYDAECRRAPTVTALFRST